MCESMFECFRSWEEENVGEFILFVWNQAVCFKVSLWKGSMMVRWLTLSVCSEKVAGLTQNQSPSVWSLLFLAMYVCFTLANWHVWSVCKYECDQLFFYVVLWKTGDLYRV